VDGSCKDGEGLERVHTDRVKVGQRDRCTGHVAEGLESVHTDRVKDGQRDRWMVHVRIFRIERA
jgi:hypothetical protein